MKLSYLDHLSQAGIEKWLAEVGVTSAPIPRNNVRITLEFFCRHMGPLPLDKAVNFLRAMDLS